MTMRLQRMLAVLPLIALLPLAAPAADKEGRFAWKGISRMTCERYSAERQKGTDAIVILKTWLDGYITALNQFQPDTFDIASSVDTFLLAQLLENHCRDNPKDPLLPLIASAMGRLNQHDRLRQVSQPVETKSGDQTVVVYQDVMRRSQEALKARGHYKGGVDGQFGPKTREAFQSFQKKEGLEATGLPDQPTLFKLLEPFGPSQ
ncbi:MAG: peptidoglycan-binding protein [Pseudomonadota bacterium]|nr:peptidoglycan-binding protein [Pseudomonadota bacterium]